MQPGPGASATSSSPGTPRHLVVMGVSGTGKTAVAEPLAKRLGYAFAEADDFHPQANLDKMAAGQPLTDDDRWPWLESLASWTRVRAEEGTPTVVACSALRRAYRDVLRRGSPDTFFVHLSGDPSLIRERMSSREHFMRPSMLQSQLDALEPLEPDERGVEIDVSAPIEAIVTGLLERLR